MPPPSRYLQSKRSSGIARKLNFTLLFAKYYLYSQKLSQKELSLNEFIVKL